MEPNTSANTSPVPSHPVVHLSGDPEALGLAGQEIREALDTHGYFLVEYDDVSKEERERLIEGMRGLFDLPEETKRRSSAVSSYRGGHPFLPIYQAFTVVDADQMEKAEAFARLMWPEGNDAFSDALHVMSNKLSRLSRGLLDVILDSYGLGRCPETHNPYNMNKYSAPEGGGPADGVHEHVDTGYLTVLGQNEVGGLEVKNKGGDWVGVDPGQSCFLVVAGQALQDLSRGRVHATFHRLRLRGVKDRFSFGSFLSPMPVDVLPDHDG